MNTYYVYDNESQSGPYSIGEILKMRSEGSVSESAYFLNEGMSEWKPIKTLLEQITEEEDEALLDNNSTFEKDENSLQETRGLSRSQFGLSFIGLIIFAAFINVFTQSGLGVVFGSIGSVFLAAYRYHNMGKSPFWAILAFIPIVSLFVFIECFSRSTADKFKSPKKSVKSEITIEAIANSFVSFRKKPMRIINKIEKYVIQYKIWLSKLDKRKKYSYYLSLCWIIFVIIIHNPTEGWYWGRSILIAEADNSILSISWIDNIRDKYDIDVFKRFFVVLISLPLLCFLHCWYVGIKIQNDDNRTR